MIERNFRAGIRCSIVSPWTMGRAVLREDSCSVRQRSGLCFLPKDSSVNNLTFFPGWNGVV